MLSEKAIASFQQVYRQEFGTEINRDEAVAMGTKLLRLFKLIYQPIPKEWLDELITKSKKEEVKNGKHSKHRK